MINKNRHMEKARPGLFILEIKHTTYSFKNHTLKFQNNRLETDKCKEDSIVDVIFRIPQNIKTTATFNLNINLIQ